MGRGVSIECGLNWDAKDILNDKSLSQSEQKNLIQKKLIQIQHSSKINLLPYRELLQICEKHTVSGVKHVFSTLNWDTLFEQAINEKNWQMVPYWLGSSFVYHLNGNSENGDTGDFIENKKLKIRSDISLPNDSINERKKSVELNSFISKMVGNKGVVAIVGMSLQNETDKFFEKIFEYYQPMQLGECDLVIVNPCGNVLETIVEKFKLFLRKPIVKVEYGFSAWLNKGCPELKEIGVFK